MTQMNVRSERQDRAVHTATVDEPTLLKLTLDAVAQQVGVNAGAAHVTARVFTSSYQEGSLGTSKTCVKVELVVDHTGAIDGAASLVDKLERHGAI